MEASSTIFWVISMTQPGIGPRSPGQLANIQTIMPMSGMKYSLPNIYLWSLCNNKRN